MLQGDGADGEHGQRACAACKHQRKKCTPDCLLAQHFPASKTDDFKAVHRVFGISNILKMLRRAAERMDVKRAIVNSLVWEAMCRKKEPVLGPYGEYLKVRQENKELQQRVANCRCNPNNVVIANNNDRRYMPPPSHNRINYVHQNQNLIVVPDYHYEEQQQQQQPSSLSPPPLPPWQQQQQQHYHQQQHHYHQQQHPNLFPRIESDHAAALTSPNLAAMLDRGRPIQMTNVQGERPQDYG